LFNTSARLLQSPAAGSPTIIAKTIVVNFEEGIKEFITILSSKSRNNRVKLLYIKYLHFTPFKKAYFFSKKVSLTWV
jgi:hypothetical protein